MLQRAPSQISTLHKNWSFPLRISSVNVTKLIKSYSPWNHLRIIDFLLISVGIKIILFAQIQPVSEVKLEMISYKDTKNQSRNEDPSNISDRVLFDNSSLIPVLNYLLKELHLRWKHFSKSIIFHASWRHQKAVDLPIFPP